MGTKKNINFSNKKSNGFPKSIPKSVQQPQWQKANNISFPKPDSAKKSVKFAVEDGRNNDHFTKPTYLGQVNPPINQNRTNDRIKRTQSVTEFPKTSTPKNSIPTRAPSNSGFRPSFMTSEPPSSAKEQKRYIEQEPASIPSGYSDKTQLGASAARITEMLKKSSEGNFNPYNNIDGDGNFLYNF